MNKITVLGAGTWAVALAKLLKLKGYEVTVWSAIEAELEELATTKAHHNLPGMVMPEGVVYEADIETALDGAELILMAVASAFVRKTTGVIAPYVKGDQYIVSVAKGLEAGTHFTMTEIIEDELQKNGAKLPKVAALSGPTHAEEVALEMPTTIVAAAEDESVAVAVQDVFTTSYMRVYTNTDIKGIELCGALKNVIALAAGISTGLGNGDNAKAAIITRGIAEIGRLGLAMGCEFSTFCGLAGIGDLIVTATSVHSRNNRCGALMGEGKSAEEAKKEVGMVVEGIYAIPGALELSKEYNVELPITEIVHQIVEGEINASDGFRQLMGREKKAEF